MCQKVITLIGWKSIVVLRTLANVRPIWVWNMCTASLRHADGCWLLLVYLPPCVPTHIKIVLNLCIQINKSFINVYVCLCFVDFYSLLFCMYWVRAIYELRFLRDCALIERAVQKCYISVMSLASLDFPLYIGWFCLFHYLLLSAEYDDISIGICILKHNTNFTIDTVEEKMDRSRSAASPDWMCVELCWCVCVCESTHLYLNLIYTKMGKWTTYASFYLWIMIK